MEPLAVFQHKGQTLRIWQDDCAESPRERFDGNIGTLCLSHRRYDLPNESGLTPDELLELLESSIRERLVVLEVRGYDHGSLTIGVSGSDPCLHDLWDSGRLGVIYADIEKARKILCIDDPEELRKAVISSLEEEVKEFNRYLNGCVFGYTLEGPGKAYDSCWGYYGDTWEEAFKGTGAFPEELLKYPMDGEREVQKLQKIRQENFMEFLEQEFGQPEEIPNSWEESMALRIAEQLHRLRSRSDGSQS